MAGRVGFVMLVQLEGDVDTRVNTYVTPLVTTKLVDVVERWGMVTVLLVPPAV